MTNTEKTTLTVELVIGQSHRFENAIFEIGENGALTIYQSSRRNTNPIAVYVPNSWTFAYFGDDPKV